MTTTAQECAETAQNHEAWHAARRTGIGGSDAAACLGVSPWTSAFTLYSERVGLIERREAGEAAAWGRRLERPIRRWYADETDRSTETADMIADPIDERIPDAYVVTISGGRVMLRSKRWPFMIANVDGFAFDHERETWGVLEIKCTGNPDAWEDGPPEYVYAQVQHYLAVTGLQWGAIAVLFRGNRGGHMDVERDDEYIERLIDAERDMWERIQRGDPPDPDTSESTNDALREIYGKSSGETIELPAEADALIAGIESAKRSAKAANELRRIDETRLRALMGAAKIGRTPDGGEVKRVDVREKHVDAYTAKAYSYFRTKAAG